MSRIQPSADLMPDRSEKNRGLDRPHRIMCKGCGKAWLAINDPRKPCSDCGGEAFFRDCNLILIGKSKDRQALKNIEWRRSWADRMRDKHPNPV